MKEGNAEAVKAYLCELNPSDQYEPLFIGNIALDALISAKASMAKAAGIDFIVQIKLPPQIPITDVSLSILFGGLLDNAFEAIAELPENENHYVKIATKVIDEYWVVVCQNLANHKVLNTVDAIPSTKSEGELHGIGTRQIVEIARETGGFATFTQKGGVFTATVMLMLKEENILGGNIDGDNN